MDLPVWISAGKGCIIKEKGWRALPGIPRTLTGLADSNRRLLTRIG